MLNKTHTPRELPIALAHVMASAKWTDPRWEAFRRIFGRLTFAEQMRCKTELRACRAAIRGETQAAVA